MAVQAHRVTVTTSETTLASVAEGTGQESSARNFLFWLAPGATAQIVYVGPTGVTTGNGARWNPEPASGQGPLSFTLEPGETAVARVAAGTLDVDGISTGR